MNPQIDEGTRPIRKLLLVALGLASVYVQVQARGPTDRRVAAIDEASRIRLADESIRIDPGADVSVRTTPEGLFIQIRHGEALLKARTPGQPPIVVRAGSAQVRDFDAVVCVGMESNRASIDVIDGEARVGNVDAESRVLNGVTLHAGNRAEISDSGAVVSFRLGGSRVGPQQPCRWSIEPPRAASVQ